MTNEELNCLEKRGYAFGENKAIEVPYDKNTDAIVMKECAFIWLLEQIPSGEKYKNPITIDGKSVD